MDHDERRSFVSDNYISFDLQRSRKRSRSPSTDGHCYSNSRQTFDKMYNDEMNRKNSSINKDQKDIPINKPARRYEIDDYPTIKDNRPYKSTGHYSDNHHNKWSMLHFDKRPLYPDDRERWRSASVYRPKNRSLDPTLFQSVKTDRTNQDWESSCSGHPQSNEALSSAASSGLDEGYERRRNQSYAKGDGRYDRLNSELNMEVDRARESRKQPGCCYTDFDKPMSSRKNHGDNRSQKSEGDYINKYNDMDESNYKRHMSKPRMQLGTIRIERNNYTSKQSRNNMNDMQWKTERRNDSHRNSQIIPCEDYSYSSRYSTSSPKRSSMDVGKLTRNNEAINSQPRHSTWDAKFDCFHEPRPTSSYTTLDVPLSTSVSESITSTSIQNVPVIVTSPNHSYHTEAAVLNETTTQVYSNREAFPPPKIVNVHLQDIPSSSLHSVSQPYSETFVENNVPKRNDCELPNIMQKNNLYSNKEKTSRCAEKETKNAPSDVVERGRTLLVKIIKKRKIRLDMPSRNLIENDLIEEESGKLKVNTIKKKEIESIEHKVTNAVDETSDETSVKVKSMKNFNNRNIISQTNVKEAYRDKKIQHDPLGLVDSSEDEDDKRLATKKFGMRTKKMQGGDIHRKGKIENKLCSGNKKRKSNSVESVEDQFIGIKTKKSDIQIAEKSSTNVKKSVQSVGECSSSVCNLPKSQIQDCTDPSLVTVGCRVAIYWDGEVAYFRGTVTKILLGKKLPFRVTYDDGDKDWVNFDKERFRILKKKASKDTPKDIVSGIKLTDMEVKETGKSTSMLTAELGSLKSSNISKSMSSPRNNINTKQDVAECRTHDISQPRSTEHQSELSRMNRESNDQIKAPIAQQSKSARVSKTTKLSMSHISETPMGQCKQMALEQSGNIPCKPLPQVANCPQDIVNGVQHQDSNSAIAEDDWVTAGMKYDSSDSETDEEEILEWGLKMFGVARPKNHAIQSNSLNPLFSNGGKQPDASEQDIEEKRKKEQAKPLTSEEIRRILGEDSHAKTAEHWVRRSSRQPSKSVLNGRKLKSLLEKLRCNDSDMIVLKMKKYCSDPATPQVVLDAVLDALEDNTNCEALYVQVILILLRFEKCFNNNSNLRFSLYPNRTITWVCMISKYFICLRFYNGLHAKRGALILEKLIRSNQKRGNFLPRALRTQKSLICTLLNI